MAGRFGTHVLGIALLAVAQVARAATFTVDSTADAVDVAPGDGACATAADECTVRAAIQEANALPGADTIVVDEELGGNVTLTIAGAGEDAAATGDLDVTENVVIDGRRPLGTGIVTLGIAGGGLDRVLHVLPGVTATITNIALSEGSTGPGENGGCLLNEGTLDGHIIVQFCHAGGDGGGLYNSGTADVASRYRLCTADGKGGGIANTGTLKLRRDIYYASIARNEATSGGGIWNAGTISGNALSIMENHATSGAGGGLLNDAGAVARLANLTVGANTAASGGEGIENLGAVNLRYVTVAEHASLGIRNDDAGGATSSVLGAIVADPCDGSLDSGGHNVTLGCSLAGTQPSDQIDVDPELESHASCAARYFGDICPNYRPARTSPAVDAGDPADCNDAFGAPLVVDQWGIYRPTGAVCDAGAIETMPICADGAPATRATLMVSGIGRGPGRQTIKFKGTFSENDLPSLSLLGAQLAVDDLGAGESLFERSAATGGSLPAGGSIPFSCHMWKRSSSGFTYREIDRNCPIPPGGGLVKSVKVKDRTALMPPLSPYVEIKFNVTKVTLDAPTGPLRTSFVYGWFPHFSQGKCAEIAFGPTACVTIGTKMKCTL
jgi:CSLREA domain-containing protein